MLRLLNYVWDYIKSLLPNDEFFTISAIKKYATIDRSYYSFHECYELYLKMERL